ncbi:MAG TPA: hypothetical protein VKP30_26685 [Polyangiaceae bacterium]|nr:hypothetical protein [Polyangiaceae bacterium]
MKPPIPDFDPIGLALPGPWLMALSYLTLTLHFVAMQFTVGGALVLLATWRRQHGIAKFFGTALPLGFSYLVTFGIPPLLFVQVVYGQFFYSSSVLIGAFWISVIPLIILGYGASYWHRMSRESAPKYQLLLIAATTCVVLLVGYIYVNNFTLSMRPERWLSHYQAHPSGGALNQGEPTLHARYALFIVPALFAAGLALVVRAGYLRNHGATSEADVSYRYGIRSMFVAAALQTIAAIGLATTLPAPVKAALFQPGALSTCAVGSAVLGVSALAAAVLSRRRAGTGMPVLAAHLFVGAVACLVVARDLVRQIYLRPYFQLDRAPVIPQWGMAISFVLILVAGLVFLGVITKQMVSGLIKGQPSAG